MARANAAARVNVGDLWLALQAIKDLGFQSGVFQDFKRPAGNAQCREHGISHDKNGSTLACEMLDLAGKIGNAPCPKDDFRKAGKGKGLHGVIRVVRFPPAYVPHRRRSSVRHFHQTQEMPGPVISLSSLR